LHADATETHSDLVQISGLATILDEGEGAPPYLELTLRCNGHEYNAAILAAESDWVVRVRDGSARSLTEDVDLYASQGDALLVALLIALDDSRSRD
jgi:hypothetical protein